MSVSQSTVETVPPMPAGPIGGAAAWRGPDIAKSRQWLIEFSDQDLAELDRAIKQHVASGRGMDQINPETFALPTLKDKLAGVLDQLLAGCGFVLLRGFSVDAYSVSEAAIGYLGVGSYFGRFGHRMPRVICSATCATSAKISPIRRRVTIRRTARWSITLTVLTSLLCCASRRRSKAAPAVSSVPSHCMMRFWRAGRICGGCCSTTFRRTAGGEVPPGMKPWFDVPVFNWYDGQLTTIYVGQYIRSAQKNFPEARRLSPLEHEAIDFSISSATTHN